MPPVGAALFTTGHGHDNEPQRAGGDAMNCGLPQHEIDPTIATAVGWALDAAEKKHGVNGITHLRADDPRWLAILTEEVGEVAHALTYDSGASQSDLLNELVQVVAVAASWAAAIYEETT